jgi:hypothetical protein
MGNYLIDTRYPRFNILKRTALSLPARIGLLVVLASLMFVGATRAVAGLDVNIISAYNFVVDSNVTSPSTYGPEAATVGAEICNTSGADMTDVFVYIGDNASGTPGEYPERDSSTAAFIAEHPHLANSGIYELTHEGGSVGTGDATRFIGDLADGECVVQYWLISYPQLKLDDDRVSVTGDIKPEDDLWLTYDIWADSSIGTTVSSQTVTLRNEISAAANKIWPNTDSKVPDEYITAIQDVLGWDTWTESGGGTAYPGEVASTQGIWYDFGVAIHGFDNNGDYIPDQNAWAQPIGDPGVYDPGCFRLVHTYGIVVVKLKTGGELLIPFEDELYFEDLPDNTGVVGLVYYEFSALDGACSAGVTPYQEVASGYDNEKFAGDYGVGVPPLQSVESHMTFTKVIAAGAISIPDTLTHTLTFTNPIIDPGGADLSLSVGNPEYGTPLVIEDSIPPGTQYVGGSATQPATVGATILYSTDNGQTWSSTEPGDPTLVTDIQWWLDTAFPGGTTDSVSFQTNVPVTYPYTTVPNTGELKFGDTNPFLEASDTTYILGTNEISGTVFEDVGTGIDYADGTLDTGENGIDSVTVTLYYTPDGGTTWIEWTTTTTADGLGVDPLGYYEFTLLPDGDYQVVVSSDTLATPTYDGWTSTSLSTLDVTGLNSGTSPDLDNDFGFAPVLAVEKSVYGDTVYYEGETVTYTIDLTNQLPGDGTEAGGFCTYYVWADHAVTSTVAQKAFNPYIDNAEHTVPNAQDSPDGAYITSTLAAAGEFVVGDDWSLGVPDASITGATVEAIFQIYYEWDDPASPSSTDEITLTLRDSAGTELETVTYTPDTTPSLPYGEFGVFSWTLGTTFTWADFNAVAGSSMELELLTDKTADSIDFHLDALGFRITTTSSSHSEITNK